MEDNKYVCAVTVLDMCTVEYNYTDIPLLLHKFNCHADEEMSATNV